MGNTVPYTALELKIGLRSLTSKIEKDKEIQKKLELH